MTTPILETPVRGSYPHPALISLPGPERTRVEGGRSKFPPPPIHHLFGVRPISSGPTGAVFSMPASPWLQTHAGVFLAGVSALVADAPLGSAIGRELAPNVFGTTSQLSMSFQRPASVESKELLARASVVDIGSTLALSEAVVEDAHGRLLALMTSRYYLISVGDLPEPPEVWVPDVPTYDTPDPHERPVPPELEPRYPADLGGLDLFRAVMDGSLPPAPFSELFGVRAREVSEGRVESTTTASEWFCSPARTVYGGVLAFLADAALLGAASTTVPAGSTCGTLDLTLHFLRPVFPTGEELTVIGEVVHRGRNLIVAQTQIRNAEGKPVVMGSGSVRVIEGRTWQEISMADAPGDEAD